MTLEQKGNIADTLSCALECILDSKEPVRYGREPNTLPDIGEWNWYGPSTRFSRDALQVKNISVFEHRESAADIDDLVLTYNGKTNTHTFSEDAHVVKFYILFRHDMCISDKSMDDINILEI